ncbi:MAG: substrate-binding domain-containing protein, partial [Methanocorpusculum parvum]|nr:substrate-binding domain-containing protein [Methanocorpusculum parvum]
INSTGYVSSEARKRVLASIKELNYVPNELARHLFRNRSGIVALLVPVIDHPFFSSFVQSFEEELAQNGYKLMLCATNSNAELELEYLSMLQRNMVDGIISGVYTEDTRVYADLEQPVVAFDRYLGPSIPMVHSDHKQGVIMATELFVELGRRKVLHRGNVSGMHAYQSMPFMEKGLFFEQLVREHGITYVEYKTPDNNIHLRPPSDEVFRSVLQAQPDIDAFFGSDMEACTIIRVAQQLHKRVPEDLAVISYDGTQITQALSKPLTCIVQPMQAIARNAVQLLIDQIEGKRFENHTVCLPVTLRRGATA